MLASPPIESRYGRDASRGPSADLLRGLLRDLDQRGDRRGLVHASPVRHRRPVVVERKPFLLPVPVRKGRQVQALAGRGLHGQDRDDPLAGRPVRRRPPRRSG